MILRNITIGLFLMAFFQGTVQLIAMDEKPSKKQKIREDRIACSLASITQHPVTLLELQEEFTKRKKLNKKLDSDQRHKLWDENKIYNPFPSAQLQLLMAMDYATQLQLKSPHTFDLLRSMYATKFSCLPDNLLSPTILRYVQVPCVSFNALVNSTKPLNIVAISNSGTYLFCISDSTNLSLYHVSSTATTLITTLDMSDPAPIIAINQEETIAAIGDFMGNIQFIQLQYPKVPLSQNVVGFDLKKIAFNKKGNLLATLAGDHIDLYKLYIENNTIQLQLQDGIALPNDVDMDTLLFFDFLNKHTLCCCVDGKAYYYYYDKTKNNTFVAKNNSKFDYVRQIQQINNAQQNHLLFIGENNFVGVRENDFEDLPFSCGQSDVQWESDIDLEDYIPVVNNQHDYYDCYAVDKTVSKLCVAVTVEDADHTYFVRCLDLTAQSKYKSSVQCDSEILKMVLNDNGDILATLHKDATVSIWNVKNLSDVKLLKQIPISQGGISVNEKDSILLQFVANDRYIALVYAGRSLMLDVGIFTRLGTCLKQLVRHNLCPLITMFMESVLKLDQLYATQLQSNQNIFPLILTEVPLLRLKYALPSELQSILGTSGLLR